MKTFKDYHKEGRIKVIIDRLSESYIELQSYRKDYDILEKALYNPFDNDFTLGANTKKLKILKSHFISTAVDEFSRGMRFPVFEVKAKDMNKDQNRNIQRKAQALLDWFIRTTEFEDSYNEAKESWCAFGDGYLLPYSRKVVRKRIRANKNIDKNLARPGVENIEGRNILFDTSGTDVMSESAHKKISFYATTNILSKEQLVGEYGKWILDYAKEGAIIDVDSLSDKNGAEKNQTKYYEVIKYQSWAEEEEFHLIGGNAFPYLRRQEGVAQVVPKKLEGKVFYEDVYPHRNTYGEAIITLWNFWFYYNRKSIRNYGLAGKLFGAQIAHEILENAKLASTRKRLFEIISIAGGSSQTIKSHLEEFEEKYQDNILTFLHLPSNVQNIIPQAQVLRFDSVTAQEAEQTSADIHSFARNSIGVSLTRLEVQKNIGVGQSEIIQEEKTIAVEQIVEKNMQNLRKTFTGVLDYSINNNGFGSSETVNVIQTITTEGDTREISIETPVSYTIKQLAKDLQEYDFSIYIDKDSIVKRSQIAQTQKLIDFFGTIDPNALPGLSKKIAKRIGEILRLDIRLDDLQGIENSQAQGGKSQFKTQQNEAPVQTPVV